MNKLETQRKIINQGIHDIGNATCTVSANIELMLRKLKKNELTLEELPERFEKIIKACERVDKATDYIYSESKKLRENE
jgi:predicted phage-related endonuclease